MSSLDDTMSRIRTIMEQKLQLTIQPEAVQDDLHLDSMALLELVVGLEKEFAVEVDEDELDSPEHFKSVESIAKFVLQQS